VGLRRNPTHTANAASHSIPSSLELGGAAAEKTALYGKALFFNICPITMFGATAALLAGASDDARLGRAWGWKLEARGEPTNDWGGWAI